MIKTPTAEDFLNYQGAHTHKLWASVGPHWKCPACKRNKFEILRWTTRFPGSSASFKDWMAPLHGHHDHGQGLRSAAFARFPSTVICDQCNTADGQAKRRCGLPKDFSFAPCEISEFITSAPHSPHKLDLAKAKSLYDSLRLPQSLLPRLPGV